MADQILAALRELTEAVLADFFGNDTSLSKRLIKATNEAQLVLMVQPPADHIPGATKMVTPPADPTPSDRLALALCRSFAPISAGYPDCPTPCSDCREQSAAVAHELAAILRERHGGSSQVADWLDGVGALG